MPKIDKLIESIPMEEHIVKILEIIPVTHNVKHYRVEKPAGYSFIPGQATEVCINKPEWESESRPFTFTSLNDWDFLEFTIKSYPNHEGVTKELDKLVPGDELILHDVWGAIHYVKPGLFIAGGAGVTPFISILRDLQFKGELNGNRLLFANKTKKDIILFEEFKEMLGDNFINLLSEEDADGYYFGYLTEEILELYYNNKTDYSYLCGPPQMMKSVQVLLEKLGITEKNLIIEL